jgi:hypothetical protein
MGGKLWNKLVRARQMIPWCWEGNYLRSSEELLFLCDPRSDPLVFHHLCLSVFGVC